MGYSEPQQQEQIMVQKHRPGYPQKNEMSVLGQISVGVTVAVISAIVVFALKRLYLKRKRLRRRRNH